MFEISAPFQILQESFNDQAISFNKSSPWKWKMVVFSHFTLATTDAKPQPNAVALGNANYSVCIWEILITASAFTNTLEESLEPKGAIEVKVIFAAMNPVRKPKRNFSQGTGFFLLSELCFDLVTGLEIKDGFAYPTSFQRLKW